MNIDLLELFKSKRFAIILSLMLMLVQTFHTSFALLDLTALPKGIDYSFAILTALFMDFLIVFSISSGAKTSRLIAFGFCALMNVYAYHLPEEMIYFTYKSWFSMVPAIGVPLAVHRVAGISGTIN